MYKHGRLFKEKKNEEERKDFLKKTYGVNSKEERQVQLEDIQFEQDNHRALEMLRGNHWQQKL